MFLSTFIWLVGIFVGVSKEFERKIQPERKRSHEMKWIRIGLGARLKWRFVPSFFCVLSIKYYLPIDCYQWNNSNQVKLSFVLYFVICFYKALPFCWCFWSFISYNFVLSAIHLASGLGFIASSNACTICLCKELYVFQIQIFGVVRPHCVCVCVVCRIMYKMD